MFIWRLRALCLVINMADNMTPEQRSRTMARIRSKDTAAELSIRRVLHRRGLRYRVNVRSLPGKPDMVFSRSRIVVFIDGDFWHGRFYREQHQRWTEYWQKKIAGNMDRDRHVRSALEAQGWIVVRIWEHEIKADLEACAEAIEKIVRCNAPDC